MKIKIKRLDPRAILPSYSHGPEEDAGMDLYALEEVVMRPHVPVSIATGIAISLPPGFEAQIRGRSGLGLNHGIRVAQGVGTIDPSYRGEVKGLLVWEGHNPNHWVCHNDPDIYLPVTEGRYIFKPGDRICQMVIGRYEGVEWDETEVLAESSRGEGGFGSTGN